MEHTNKPLTAEEKSERIREYCEKHAYCENCSLFSFVPSYELCYELSGEIPCNIDRNYAIVFGNEAADSIRQSEDKAKPNIPANTDKDVDAMSCWHYIAPLIPVTDDPMTISIYVNTFRAFKLLEAEQMQRKPNAQTK